MKWIGWTSMILGAAGVIACGLGVHKTRQVEADVARGTRTLAAQARGLLDSVDATLKELPARWNKLSESDRPQPVLAGLGRLEGRLASAEEAVGAAVTLLRAASALKQGDDATVEERFPRLMTLATSLTSITTQVGAQIENVETWTLRFAVLTRLAATLREDVAHVRRETERLESDALSTLDSLAFYALLFLLWMGAGQVALIVMGRRKAASALDVVG